MTNKGKTVARLSAIQVLYLKDSKELRAEDAYNEFLAYHLPTKSHQGLAAPDAELLKKIFYGVLNRREEIHQLIKDNLPPEWHFDRLEIMLKIILECACFEIISSLDLHAKIILNEYVNIASSYFSQKETVFVNGVLNSIARKYRPESFSQN